MHVGRRWPKAGPVLAVPTSAKRKLQELRFKKIMSESTSNGMLDPADMQRLVEMQHRSYRLLGWMAEAVTKKFVSFETAHDYSTLPEAAEAWISRHYLNIPENARPEREQLATFSAFFSTYVTNSFDLISNPGKRRYSPDAHCFCPMCSWLIDAPVLKPKKLTTADKRSAQKMRIQALKNLAAHHRLGVAEEQLQRLLDVRSQFEDASLVAYALDLLQREQGIANGPAVLALWRGFAWTESGSPKSGFRLTAKTISAAEARLVELLKCSS
jgi:hypothetical protein